MNSADFPLYPYFNFIGLACLLMITPVVNSTQAADTSGREDLALLQARIANIAEPMIWITTGDSITHGAKWLGRERSYPELIQEQIRWPLGRRRDFVINTGISGERTTGLLADFNWRVTHFNPQVVSIMIGMNDAVAGPEGREQFATNLRELVRRTRATGAIPILHRTNPIDEESASSDSRRDLPAYNQIIDQVAQSTATILIDHWSRWSQERPTLPLLREWLADPIHPNGVGHRAFAQEFFRTLGYDYTPPTDGVTESP